MRETWGFVPSALNVTYLVFVASDSLATAVDAKVPGRFGGIHLYVNEDLDEMIAAQEKFVDAAGIESKTVQ